MIEARKLKIDSPKDQTPSVSYCPRCYYCGKFVGKNDQWSSDRIYGAFSAELDVFYHDKCKPEPCQNCGVPGNHDNEMCSKCWNEL